MADKPKTYLQAASMKALLNGLSGLHLMEDGSVSPKNKHGFRPGRFFKHGKVAAELLARFAALEAERDALRARLAEAERLLRFFVEIDDMGMMADVDLYELAIEKSRAFTQPPTAEGGDQ